MPNYITGLDIGTTKIGVVIGEVDDEEELRIVAVASAPSEGLRRGVVVNLEKTVQSIIRAVSEAEQMAGVTVDSVYAGIAGDHIRSINGRGVVAVAGPNNEITEDDVRRVIDAAKAVALPIDREIIHILPQEFIVDDQRGIKDPVGMAGVRLEAEVHIVTGAVTSAQNIYRSIERAGLKVRDLVLEPLASSLAVLTEDEKELGVVLIDLGGGTTDIAMFYQGCIRHTGVVGLGGRNVTNDIAIGLRTPVDQAEEIKIRYGCAIHRPDDDKEVIEVPGIGGRAPRKVSKALLVDIIQPRMEEILSLAFEEVKRSEFAGLMNGGVVLTGGGSLLDGTLELAEEIFG
ncbi:MAG: cell division protein FtsA, partial [candidate division KSB1 bacterium]|nr:cell division protein FtsA [candidate division KSB1 bacterium]